jgi:hypothetical protein
MRCASWDASSWGLRPSHRPIPTAGGATRPTIFSRGVNTLWDYAIESFPGRHGKSWSTSLDGTWDHNNGSDEWDGKATGETAGKPGGAGTRASTLCDGYLRRPRDPRLPVPRNGLSRMLARGGLQRRWRRGHLRCRCSGTSYSALPRRPGARGARRIRRVV